MPDLFDTIKQIAVNAMEANKPVEITFGTVQTVHPLRVRLSQKIVLEKNMLAACAGFSASKLYAGDKLLLLRFQGGQRYLILDKAGEIP